MNLDKVIKKRKNKVIYRDNDKIIKAFSNEYTNSEVLNEALNHARAEETGLLIPKIHEVLKLEDGRWAIVTDYIEGKTLAQLMQENPDKIDEYMNQFVDLQLLVHSKQSPLLSKVKDKMNRKISQTDLEATIRYELHTRLNGMPKHVKMCHGDFKPSNIIVNETGWYIIDWSHATQGNASADVARSYLLFCLDWNNELADKYLKTFCLKSDTAIQYVQKWLPIVAASQLVKKNPEQKKFLEKWIDVVEYE